jgi:hypothetical protein
MAGGAVVADTCLAFNRKCWSFDLLDRIKTRPEIEPFLWDHKNAGLLLEYAKLLENCGWKITHLIDCPLSTERFTGGYLYSVLMRLPCIKPLIRLVDEPKSCAISAQFISFEVLSLESSPGIDRL